jgi:hypothetical protein
MTTLDIRVGKWSVRADAGTTETITVTWLDTDGEAFTGLESSSLWLGGTATDVDDFTGADEIVGTVDANEVTFAIDVPDALTSVRLRMTANDQIATTGILSPSAIGSSSGTDVTVNLGTASVTVQAQTPGGSGGVTVHNNLTGRDTTDAHPQAAITGLTAALAALEGPVFSYTDGDDWSDLIDTLAAIDGPKSLQFQDDLTQIPAGTWDLNQTTLVGRGVYGVGTGGTVVECGEGVHLSGLGSPAAQGGIVLYSTATTHPIVDITEPTTVILTDDAAVCSASAAFFHVDNTTAGNVVFSIRYGSGLVDPGPMGLAGSYEALDVDALDNPGHLVILVDPTVGNSTTEDDVIRGSGSIYRFLFSAATLAPFGGPATKGDTQTNLTGGVTVVRAETASRMFYSNATSGLSATTVQAAIDEVEDRVHDLETGTGWTVLADETLGTAAAQIDVDLTTAPASMWRARFVGRADPTGSATVGLRARFNSDSGNNYSTGGAAASGNIVLGNVTASQTNADRVSEHSITWSHITGGWTVGTDSNETPNSTASTAPTPNTQGWAWMVTTTPTLFSLFPASGSFVAGTRLVVEAR